MQDNSKKDNSSFNLEPTNSLKNKSEIDKIFNIYSGSILNKLSKDQLVSNLVDKMNFEKIKNDINIDTTITQLQKDWMDKIERLTSIERNPEEEKSVIQNLKLTIERLKKELSLKTLLTQVNEEAGKKLLSDKKFIDLFDTTKECESYVISIDIRRSTELMLKARTPALFEYFIATVCDNLARIITTNYGIFDKFTGDGIIAFFPNFYSGDDAGLLAIKASIECHDCFNKFYNSNRHCFNSILKDIGLGIGIDFGQTHLTIINSYTLIGAPVAYACRLSSAPANNTYVNQPAYETLAYRYSQQLSFTETHLDIKHEGETIVYSIKPLKKNLDLTPPNWDELTNRFSISKQEDS